VSASAGPGNHKTNNNSQSVIHAMKRIIIACLLTVSLVASVPVLHAADNSSSSVASPAPASVKPAKQMPFYGTVKAVDTSARTLTLAGKEKDRLFHLNEATKIHDGGEPRTLEDVKIGRRVGGLAKANSEGQWVIATLNLGVKQSRTAQETEEAAALAE